MKTKKKYELNPVKFSIIVIIGFILLVIFLQVKTKERIRYQVLECTSNSISSENHNERMTFKFIIKDSKLYEYNRNEIYTYEDKDEREQVFDKLVESRDSIKDYIDVNLKYSIEEKDNNIYVDTYINVYNNKDLFDSYFTKIGISSDSSAKEIFETLSINDNYTCIETETM